MNSTTSDYNTLTTMTATPRAIQPVLLTNPQQAASVNALMLSAYSPQVRDQGYTTQYATILNAYATCPNNPYGPRSCA